jgi:hypothetical protein
MNNSFTLILSFIILLLLFGINYFFLFLLKKILFETIGPENQD